MSLPRRYYSEDEDSGRWAHFSPRAGDIIVSTRSKHGTTWMQMICALLIHRTPDLPAPLGELAPWLDWRIIPLDEQLAALDAQDHRRIIKTHTPLDGVPIWPEVHYVVVARHPLDGAESLYHQGHNIDRAKYFELAGIEDPPERRSQTLDEFLRRWIDYDGDHADHLESLTGVMWHVGDAWDRRDEPNVHLVHYRDLSNDLVGEMHRLARALDFEIGTDVVEQLAEHARFASMRARADQLAPDPQAIFHSRDAFFRRSGTGEWPDLIEPATLDAFTARIGEMPEAAATWLVR